MIIAIIFREELAENTRKLLATQSDTEKLKKKRNLWSFGETSKASIL